MDRTMQLYYEAKKEFYSLEERMRGYNPLRDYLDDFIDGPLLDIGCGQSAFLTELTKTDRQLIGIDNEPYQLEELRKEVQSLVGSKPENLTLINATLLQDELPTGTFSVVVMSNILHFFSLTDCRRIITDVESRIAAGSLVYVRVHSEQHPANDPSAPDNNDYFKHYFTSSDLSNLFDEEKYLTIYSSDDFHYFSKRDMMVKSRWMDKCVDYYKSIGVAVRRNFKADALRDIAEAGLVRIYRRRA